jgi:energy-coupling factor transporter ATP-binding protein EcfA2
MADPVLAMEGLSYRYPGGVRDALCGIDVEVAEGEIVLVAGASASGKSTLLRAANALVPHFHGGDIEGRVVVGGIDTRRAGPADVAEVAGSVFQDPESQVITNTAAAEIALPLENRGLAPVAVARAVEETALALGVADLLERPLRTLSGGELQRVAIAAALVAQPRLLLLDEPTSQLDPVAGDELVWQLRRLNEEWGTTVVLCEHRIERCLAAVDRVLALAGGRLVCDASPSLFVEWASTHAPSLLNPAAAMAAQARLRPLPVGVKEGRALLRAQGLEDLADADEAAADVSGLRRGLASVRARVRRKPTPAAAASVERVWVRYDGVGIEAVDALRGLTLALAPGVTAVLGRNGAGKSTLLRVAAGAQRPDRGRVRAAGDVALLLQNPGDYFLHERVRDELPAGATDLVLRELGLEGGADADPRDLAGGERQRLALAVVLGGRGLGGGEPPAAILLDEPTRGMDRAQKAALAERLRGWAERGAAVAVATHDVEFAARAADRAVLLGSGRVIADGATRDVLSSGRYFSTEVARVLGPRAHAVLPEEGARLIGDALDERARESTLAAHEREEVPR